MTNTPKTLHNSDISGAKTNVPDIKVVGNGDTWQLLCKVSSENEGWMKSTKAIQTPGGCIVQVTTQQRNISYTGGSNGGGSYENNYVIAEALTFVPGVMIVNDINNGRKLVAIPDGI